MTFCTYFTKLPPGIECLWRGVVDGGAEAQAARRSPGGLLIDLCGPMPRATGGPWVELARTGVSTTAVVRAAPAANTGTSTGAANGSTAPSRRGTTDVRLARAAEPKQSADTEIDYELDDHAKPTASGSQSANRGNSEVAANLLTDQDGLEYQVGPPPRRQTFPDDPYVEGDFARKPKSRWPLWLALSAVAVLALGLIVARLRSVDQVAGQVTQNQQTNSTQQPNTGTSGRPALPSAVTSAVTDEPSTTVRQLLARLKTTVVARRWSDVRQTMEQLREEVPDWEDKPALATALNEATSVMETAWQQRKEVLQTLIESLDLKAARTQLDMEREGSLADQAALDELEEQFQDAIRMLRRTDECRDESDRGPRLRHGGKTIGHAAARAAAVGSH